MKCEVLVDASCFVTEKRNSSYLRFSSMTVDYVLMLSLMAVLSLKYIFIDGDEAARQPDHASCQDSTADLGIRDVKDEPLKMPANGSIPSSQIQPPPHHPQLTADSVLNRAEEEPAPRNSEVVSDESSGREVEQTMSGGIL